ncbi:ADM_collapsed_G0016550.mRNA.1.CDS.1 [Saccharomyces cerevisiae]|nr:ADM_collapsed_G0016550.mRNA.1.CDS.1 [Saccharomyces cerevisiae]
MFRFMGKQLSTDPGHVPQGARVYTEKFPVFSMTPMLDTVINDAVVPIENLFLLVQGSPVK